MTQYDSYGTTGGQFCWHERPSNAQGLGLNRFRVCVQYEKCSAQVPIGRQAPSQP